MAYDIHYASGANAEDTGLPPQLMAGDTPPVSTQDFAFSLATAIGQFVPLTRVGDSFEPWAAGDQVDAISAYGIPVGDSRAAVYTEGMFNIDAINWPDGTTEVQAMTAMTGDVKYRKLLYSDKRTGNESDEVGPGNEAGQAIVVITLTPASGALDGGTEAVAYNASITAAGGESPYGYAVSDGSLPAGLSLNASTGEITGTPTTAGTSNFDVTVTDANGATTTASYSIVVAPAGG